LTVASVMSSRTAICRLLIALATSDSTSRSRRDRMASVSCGAPRCRTDIVTAALGSTASRMVDSSWRMLLLLCRNPRTPSWSISPVCSGPSCMLRITTALCSLTRASW